MQVIQTVEWEKIPSIYILLFLLDISENGKNDP